MLKRTSLFETHAALGATLVPFAGWEMPVSYPGGTVAEVAAVRAGVGLFDVSHMGEASVMGPGAFDYVQSVTTNDVAKLSSGQAQYSLLLNEAGGIIDDVIVYCGAENDYFIVLNAGCKDKDWAWLQSQAEVFPQVVLKDLSDDTALIAVQGPQAVELVARVAEDNRLGGLKRFGFTSGQIGDTRLLLSRTGYTGEDGFEIFCPWEDAPALWRTLADWGAVPAGLGARDVLRLEAAYPLYGHELDAEHGPWESGVGWAVKPGKGAFLGSESVQEGKQRGASRRLAGLQMDERAIPREGYVVLDTEGAPLGAVTSGTFSPTVKAGIALARLAGTSALPGTQVQVDIRGRKAGATVVPLPFYRNGV